MDTRLLKRFWSLGRPAASVALQRSSWRRKGYRVFAAGRSGERRASLDVLARERKLALYSLEMDVCDDGSVDRAIARIETRRRRRRCAGEQRRSSLCGADRGDPSGGFRAGNSRRIFLASVRVTQRVLPQMRARRSGRIVNMSSLAGRLALPLFGPYSGSKFALEGMTDALRLEVYPFGIEVVLIEPGYIRTEMEQTAAELSSGYRDNMEQGAYAGIYKNFVRSWRRNAGRARTTPEDCARVILRAIRDTPPRTRYQVTPGSEFFLWGMRLLPERLRDRVMRRQFGLTRHHATRD